MHRPIAFGAVVVLLCGVVFAIHATWLTLAQGPSWTGIKSASVAIQLIGAYLNWPLLSRLARMPVLQALTCGPTLPLPWRLTLLCAQVLFAAATVLQLQHT
jgi:hypothetical protein